MDVRFALANVAEALVEPDSVGLGAEDHFGVAELPADFVQQLHYAPADARSPVSCPDGDAADVRLAIWTVVEQDAGSGDGLTVEGGEDMDRSVHGRRVTVVLVDLDIGVDALLFHEHLAPDSECLQHFCIRRDSCNDQRHGQSVTVPMRNAGHLLNDNDASNPSINHGRKVHPMPDPVVHFEIPGDDLELLSNFYSRLFDWQIEKIPGDMEYYTVATGPADERGMPSKPGTIFGGLTPRMAPDQRPVNYVEVSDIDTYVARAGELGAQVAMGRTEVPGMGAFALLVDPDGNSFGIWQTIDG